MVPTPRPAVHGRIVSMHKASSRNYLGGGGDLVSIMPVCVCPKVKEMGSFLASSE